MSTLRTRMMLRDVIRLMAEASPNMRKMARPAPAGPNQETAKAKDWVAQTKAGAQNKSPVPKLIYGKVVAWPAEVKRVPYEKGEGVGPGERRLAKLLGGEIQGGSATFDLATPEGNFEVKEPTGGWHGDIRVESEGIAALEANLTKIKNVAKKIDAIFGSNAHPELVAAAKEMYPADVYQKIVDFATRPETKGQTAVQWILRGEIGAKRLQSLADTLLLINSGLLNEDALRLAQRLQRLMMEEKYVELGDTEADVTVKKPVDTSTYVKVGKALDLTPEEMKVSPADMLRAALNHPAFTNPDEFINNVINSPVKASQVFGHVDGLILVQPTGYMAIPKSELDRKMIFSRISKGKPYFRLVGSSDEDEG